MALPAGRGSLPSEATHFLQRARILDATAHAVASAGYGPTSAERICRSAGVSSRTFYEHFSGKEDAVLWAFDAAASYAVPRIVAAFRAEDEWAAGVDAALGAYLAIMDCDHAWAVLCLVELPGVATDVAARRRELLAPLVAALSAGPPADGPIEPIDVIAAIDGVLRERLLRDATAPLLGLREELTTLALSPYLGRQRTRAWLERTSAPVPAAVDLGRAMRADELVGESGTATAALQRLVDEAIADRDGPALWRVVLGLHERRSRGEAVPWRLERRVLDGLTEASFFGMPVRDMEAQGWEPPTPAQRVLRYVAEHPGSSGQEIRQALGFAHLSQVTRVLNALAEEGLVARRRPRGRANAWVVVAEKADPGTAKETCVDHEA